jgi:hypothetical protein
MPKANTEGMQQHLDIISATVTPSKHALLVADHAAWHLTAKLETLAWLSLQRNLFELKVTMSSWLFMRRFNWSVCT